MIDFEGLGLCLGDLGLSAWRTPLETLIKERLSPQAHGNLPRWLSVLEDLPASDPDTSRDLLLKLSPWRKGPFSLDGIEIDAEWRSDMKWGRLQHAIEPLDGRNVLDVGCGNGYYALRMMDAGAKYVIGIDPTVLYVVQFLAVSKFLTPSGVYVLPLRLDELPGESRAFDATFSMGVLYHQRSPLQHLRDLKGTIRPGGQLVLETIYIPGEESYACTPADRYARMRNVWLLPTLAELTTWLARSGFRDIDIIDTAVTTTDEQRTTEWMPFESLRDALDPGDASRTIEGWPAPRRVMAIAKVP